MSRRARRIANDVKVSAVLGSVVVVHADPAGQLQSFHHGSDHFRINALGIARGIERQGARTAANRRVSEGWLQSVGTHGDIAGIVNKALPGQLEAGPNRQVSAAQFHDRPRTAQGRHIQRRAGLVEQLAFQNGWREDAHSLVFTCRERIKRTAVDQVIQRIFAGVARHQRVGKLIDRMRVVGLVVDIAESAFCTKHQMKRLGAVLVLPAAGIVQPQIHRGAISTWIAHASEIPRCKAQVRQERGNVLVN